MSDPNTLRLYADFAAAIGFDEESAAFNQQATDAELESLLSYVSELFDGRMSVSTEEPDSYDAVVVVSQDGPRVFVGRDFDVVDECEIVYCCSLSSKPSTAVRVRRVGSINIAEGT